MIDSWKKLTIGKQMQICRINEGTDDEDTKILMIAALLNDLTYDEILMKSIKETEELIRCTAFLYTKPETEKARKAYILNGKKYNALIKMEDMTTAQYIDFQAISKDFDRRLDEYLAIFLIPDGHRYNDGYDRDEVMEDIRDRLGVEEALGLAAFFTRRYVRSTRRMLLWSEAAMRVMGMMAPKETRKVMKETEMMLKRLREALPYSYGFHW